MLKWCPPLVRLCQSSQCISEISVTVFTKTEYKVRCCPDDKNLRQLCLGVVFQEEGQDAKPVYILVAHASEYGGGKRRAFYATSQTRRKR